MNVTSPLSDPEVERLFSSFDLRGGVAVAVSGGADSMALALLLKRWSDQRTTPIPVIALTVDHQLRPESSKEAHTVKKWFERWDIAHHILTWDHPVLRSGIQNKARQARYALLSQGCLDHKIPNLMTAHHKHDQWETVMMRLSKGSGLTGLCGMRPLTKTNFGFLIRPFLSIEPDRLKASLREFQQPFLEDPSNQNTDYARIRWRRLLPILSEEGLTPSMVYKTALQLQQTEAFCEEQTQKALAVCLEKGDQIVLEKLQEWPLEIAHRVLKKVIRDIGQAPYGLNTLKVEALYQKISSPCFKGATAGGCYLKKISQGNIKISPEDRFKAVMLNPTSPT